MYDHEMNQHSPVYDAFAPDHFHQLSCDFLFLFQQIMIHSVITPP